MHLGEMRARSGKRSPFVRVMSELILLAFPAEQDNHYHDVSVLFIEEDVRHHVPTVKDNVLPNLVQGQVAAAAVWGVCRQRGRLLRPGWWLRSGGSLKKMNPGEQHCPAEHKFSVR
jgi:hypothetical protein